MQPCTHPIILKVRSALTLQGKSLRAVCLENGIDTGNVYPYLRGDINSKKAIHAREIIFQIAGINDADMD